METIVVMTRRCGDLRRRARELGCGVVKEPPAQAAPRLSVSGCSGFGQPPTSCVVQGHPSALKALRAAIEQDRRLGEIVD